MFNVLPKPTNTNEYKDDKFLDKSAATENNA